MLLNSPGLRAILRLILFGLVVSLSAAPKETGIELILAESGDRPQNWGWRMSDDKICDFIGSAPEMAGLANFWIIELSGFLYNDTENDGRIDLQRFKSSLAPSLAILAGQNSSYILSFRSPPAAMRRFQTQQSHVLFAPNRLFREYYGDYIRYMADLLTLLQYVGLPLPAAVILQAAPNQGETIHPSVGEYTKEGCFFTPSELHLLTALASEEFGRRGFSRIPFITPDCEGISSSYDFLRNDSFRLAKSLAEPAGMQFGLQLVSGGVTLKTDDTWLKIRHLIEPGLQNLWITGWGANKARSSREVISKLAWDLYAINDMEAGGFLICHRPSRLPTADAVLTATNSPTPFGKLVKEIYTTWKKSARTWRVVPSSRETTDIFGVGYGEIGTRIFFLYNPAPDEVQADIKLQNVSVYVPAGDWSPLLAAQIKVPPGSSVILREGGNAP